MRIFVMNDWTREFIRRQFMFWVMCPVWVFLLVAEILSMFLILGGIFLSLVYSLFIFLLAIPSALFCLEEYVLKLIPDGVLDKLTGIMTGSGFEWGKRFWYWAEDWIDAKLKKKPHNGLIKKA